VIDWLCRVSA